MSAKRLLDLCLAFAVLMFLVIVLSDRLPAQRKTESPVSPKQNLPTRRNPPRQPPAASRGYVRVGPTGHYFQFEDGTPFVPIGHNEWTGALMEPKVQSHHVDAYLTSNTISRWVGPISVPGRPARDCAGPPTRVSWSTGNRTR